jgi:hypothetical protein
MEPSVTLRNRSNQAVCVIGFNPADEIRGVDCGQYLILPGESQKITAGVAGTHLSIGIVDDTYYPITDSNFSHRYMFYPGVRGNWVNYRLFVLESKDTGKVLDLITADDAKSAAKPASAGAGIGAGGPLVSKNVGFGLSSDTKSGAVENQNIGKSATRGGSAGSSCMNWSSCITLSRDAGDNLCPSDVSEAYSYRDMDLKLFLKFLAIKIKNEPKEKIMEYFVCLFMERNVLNFDNVKDSAVFIWCIMYMVTNSISLSDVANAVLPGDLKLKLPEGFKELPSSEEMTDAMTDSVNKLPSLISVMMYSPSIKQKFQKMYAPELTDVFVDAWNIFAEATAVGSHSTEKTRAAAHKIMSRAGEVLEMGKEKAGTAMNHMAGKATDMKEEGMGGMHHGMDTKDKTTSTWDKPSDLQHSSAQSNLSHIHDPIGVNKQKTAESTVDKENLASGNKYPTSH